ncbi:MAG: alpha/beta hydrolase [Hyphomicrobiales bacterium]
MKISELDIFILPGLGGGTEKHWYHRWGAKLKTAQVIEQEQWDDPDKDEWVETIVGAVSKAGRPVFLIAHSLGTVALAHAGSRLADINVVGAFLVAIPDLEASQGLIPETASFLPMPTAPLPFPSLQIASQNDVYCTYERAEEFSLDFGSLLVDAGEQGHVNDESGHGPWPEGLMALSKFLNRLSA